jgi:hypothetical protein
MEEDVVVQEPDDVAGGRRQQVGAQLGALMAEHCGRGRRTRRLGRDGLQIDHGPRERLSRCSQSPAERGRQRRPNGLRAARAARQRQQHGHEERPHHEPPELGRGAEHECVIV